MWRTVEVAIQVADAKLGSVFDAALICFLKKVPLHVALRVITRPQDRRDQAPSPHFAT